MNLNRKGAAPIATPSPVSIPIRDLMNLNRVLGALLTGLNTFQSLLGI